MQSNASQPNIRIKPRDALANKRNKNKTEHKTLFAYAMHSKRHSTGHSNTTNEVRLTILSPVERLLENFREKLSSNAVGTLERIDGQVIHWLY